MKSLNQIISILFVVGVLASSGAIGFADQNNPPEWMSYKEVSILGRALSVASFPIRQGDLRDTLGIKQGKFLLGRSDAEGYYVGTFALTDPSADFGFYGVEITYDEGHTLTGVENRLVRHVALIFSSNHAGRFVQQDDSKLRLMYERIGLDLKKRDISPLKWAQDQIEAEEEAVRTGDMGDRASR